MQIRILGLENLQINAKIKFLVFSGESSEGSVSGESIFFEGIAGLPALIMFIVTTISAINSGIRVSHHLHIESFPVSIYLIHYLKWKVFSRSEPAEVIARFCWFCNNHQRCVTSTPMPQLPHPHKLEANPQVFRQIRKQRGVIYCDKSTTTNV